MTCTQFCCSHFALLIPGKLSPSPKEAVTDPATHLSSAVWLVEFSCVTVTRLLLTLHG